MTTSDTYIKMCRTADPIQHYKYQKGFDEGDFVYDGKKVRVVGHDFISLKREFNQSGIFVFKFAMIKSDDDFIIDNENVDIVYKQCEYEIDHIINPKWVPRLDQLLDMLIERDETTVDVLNRLNIFIGSICTKPYTDVVIEEYALGLWMRDRYRSYFGTYGGTIGWY